MNHSKSFEALLPFLKKIRRYGHEISLINYDLETCAPEKALEEEGNLINQIQAEYAALFVEKEFKKALKNLLKDKKANEYEHRLGEILYKQVELLEKMPLEEYNKANEAFTTSNVMWRKYKASGDYESWLPYFEETIKWSKKIAKYKQKKGQTPYEALLNDYEEGTSEASIDAVFTELKEAIVALLPEVNERQSNYHYHALPPVGYSNQLALSYDLLKLIKYDLKGGAIRTSTHPFSDDIARHDARLTTKYDFYDFRSNLFTTLHEGGHCMEFQNKPEEQYEHFLEGSFAFSIAETHSRFYENILGKSIELSPKLYELVRKDLGSAFEHWDGEWGFYHALTKVEPGLIRCEADELTYSLHIIIRYEIEKDIINGKLEAKDIPAVWNQKYKEYLGVDVPNNGVGCMQDTHWTAGSFGYFPTYALGNLYGAMILEKMKETLDVPALLKEGNLEPIREWFATNDFPYDHLKPKDWIMKVTGKELSATPFIEYLKAKYGKDADNKE